MQLADFPFGYMYAVRLRTPVRAVSLVLAEWLPLALALKLAYSASFWLSVVMLAGNFALYEIGYLVNDLADSASDPNGDHLGDRRINIPLFMGTHVILFLVVTTTLFFVKSTRFAITYSVLAVLVLLVFFWHTSRRPRGLRFLRLFTFAALSLYKFVPAIVPWLSLADSQTVLVAMFFCWGFWRDISYTLIKFGKKELTSQGQEFDPYRLFHLLSLLLCAPLLLAISPAGPAGKAALVIWITYIGLALFRTGYQLTNWRLTQSHYLNERANALPNQ